MKVEIRGSLPPQKIGRNAAMFSAPNQSFMQVSLPSLPAMQSGALLPYQFMRLLTICRAVPCSILHCRLINERLVQMMTLALHPKS